MNAQLCLLMPWRDDVMGWKHFRYYLPFVCEGNPPVVITAQRAHEAIITSSLRPNDVADVVLT